MNDWILINRLKQGDQAAFKEIVETWQDMVYNTSLGIVQSVEDAEDVAQEVFVQVYESINQFKGDYLAAEMVRAFIESVEYNQRFTNK